MAFNDGICSAQHVAILYCRFLYARTWELVNLFVRTKYFSYHICYENIGRKHNKTPHLWTQETDRPWTDRTERDASKKNVLNKINKERTFTPGLKDCKKIKRKVSYNLNDLENLLIKWTVKVSSEKAWLLYEFPFSLNRGDKPNDAQAWKNYSLLCPVSTEDQFESSSKKNS